MKNIYLIVAPSGAGKTTITEILEEKYRLKSIQSYTTRPPRYEGETGHIFGSDEEFDKLKNMIAYIEFDGHRYCATADQVDTHDLYVIDPKGIDYLRSSYEGAKQIKVIYIDVSLIERYERMRKRAERSCKSYYEAVKIALNRIVNDTHEFYKYIHHTAHVDFTVSNNDSDSNAPEYAADLIYDYIMQCETGD